MIEKPDRSTLAVEKLSDLFDINKTPPTQDDIEMRVESIDFRMAENTKLVRGRANVASGLLIFMSVAPFIALLAGRGFTTASLFLFILSVVMLFPFGLLQIKPREFNLLGFLAAMTSPLSVIHALTRHPSVWSGGGWKIPVLFATVVVGTAIGLVLHERLIGRPMCKNWGFETKKELFEPIATKDCPEVLTWCMEHPELAKYQGQVAGQGRKITKGEQTAMGEWIEIRTAKEEWAGREEHARSLRKREERSERLLRSPVTPRLCDP